MDWSKQIVRYIVVMLLQILLFDQLQLWNVCHPYIYILCLLMISSACAAEESLMLFPGTARPAETG